MSNGFRVQGLGFRVVVQSIMQWASSAPLSITSELTSRDKILKANLSADRYRSKIQELEQVVADLGVDIEGFRHKNLQVRRQSRQPDHFKLCQSSAPQPLSPSHPMVGLWAEGLKV